MGFRIEIIAGSDKDVSEVRVVGVTQHVITPQEEYAFNVREPELRKAVEAYFGKKPNDAYLHSETPWGDLYKSYNWPQVNTVVEAVSAEILEVTSVPTVVATKLFKNESKQKGSFSANISEEVIVSETETWSRSIDITLSQEIEYSVGFLGTGGKGTSKVEFKGSFGHSDSQTQEISIGTETGVSVELEPGESVETVLSASKGIMKLRVKYRSYLVGSTAVNYNPTYKGHHFWSLNIAEVMRAGDITNAKEYYEEVEIEYYSDASIVLKDPSSDMKRESYSLKDIPGV